jgi:hypothetical protein
MFILGVQNKRNNSKQDSRQLISSIVVHFIDDFAYSSRMIDWEDLHSCPSL